jgi:hypothetical protein
MAYGVLITSEGTEEVIEDKVLDDIGVEIVNIDDFLLKEDGATVQIFFTTGIPSDPVISANAGDIFMSYNRRVFFAYNERVFRS